MFDTVLSEFDDPPESPLSENGNWAQTTPERAPLQKGGNIAYGTSNDVSLSHYVGKVFRTGNPIEVFGCAGGGQLGADLESWRVGLWTVETAGTYGAQGYVVVQGGSISKDTSIRRYDGDGVTDFTQIAGLGSTGYPTMLGLRINGPHVEAWQKIAGVWVIITSTADFGPGDEMYRGAFYGGIGNENMATYWSCFGGNVTNRTQIYRVVKGL